MADSDITVTFVDGPSQDNSQNDTTQSGGVSALGDGLHATKESKEELYERLLNDMTDTMLDIFNVLSGKGSAGSFAMLQSAIADSASAARRSGLYPLYRSVWLDRSGMSSRWTASLIHTPL